jgi:hypothetical protein
VNKTLVFAASRLCHYTKQLHFSPVVLSDDYTWLAKFNLGAIPLYYILHEFRNLCCIFVRHYINANRPLRLNKRFSKLLFKHPIVFNILIRTRKISKPVNISISFSPVSNKAYFKAIAVLLKSAVLLKRLSIADDHLESQRLSPSMIPYTL